MSVVAGLKSWVGVENKAVEAIAEDYLA